MIAFKDESLIIILKVGDYILYKRESTLVSKMGYPSSYISEAYKNVTRLYSDWPQIKITYEI